MTNEKELEQLSEEIHKLYCTQYEKDHGTPYWTNGDYSKLEERVKEYDRNIARWYLSKLHSHTKEVVEELEKIVSNQKSWAGSLQAIRDYLASLEDNKPIEELLGKNAVIDYANDYSHYHCWNQTQPSACGIPLEKHTQCCLCGQIYEDNKK